jgi:hypothetical protein
MTFPLAAFFRILEQDDFRLTIQDYDRIAVVLATDGDWTLQRLRSVLRTLLARNRDQQDIFERRFAVFFADIAETPAGKVAINLDLIKEELEQLRSDRAGRHRGLPLRRFPKTGKVSGAPLPERTPWFPGGFFLTLLLILLIGCAVFWPDSLQEEMVIPDEPVPLKSEVQGPEPTTDLDNLPRYVVQPRRPVIASRELTPVTGSDTWQQSALIAGILFFLCCAYAWYLYRAQKVPRDKTASWDDDPILPRLFPLDRVGGKPASRLDQEILSHFADCLGYFQGDQPYREPDIPRSLIATIDNGGLPNLIFPRRKELRRLIILINQADPEALRLNPIADELAKGMERLGVQLLVGRYLQDPAVFFPEDGRARFLADYETGRNGYLLLIFSGTGELSAKRETLESLTRWPHMAWMQLRTDRFQAGSSRYGIANYPATKAGLLAAFTRFLTETGSVQKIGSFSCRQAELRGDVAISILLETRLADALPWAQACSILQPVPLGLADRLRRDFFDHLPSESIERFIALPGTSLGKGGFSFSEPVLKELRRGFQVRCPEDRRKAILECILAELDKTWQEEYGDQTKDSLARLAWQKYSQLVNLWLQPEQALKRIAELKSSPLGSAMEADLAMIDPIPLREKLGKNKDALQRLARLFGKRSGLSLLKRYPLRWFQWAGAVVLVLSLVAASGLGLQQWYMAKLNVKPEIPSKIARDNVQQYEAFGVLGSRKDSNGERWYQVTEEYVPKIKPPNWSAHPIGWISEKQIIPWRWAVVMRFTNPYNRLDEPTLFFATPEPLRRLMQKTDEVRKREMEALQEQVQNEQGGASGVMAVEPPIGERQEQMIMYPVLDFNKLPFGDYQRNALLLKVAGLTRNSASENRNTSVAIDIIFVMDTTYHMQPYLEKLLLATEQFARQHADDGLRFGFIGYQDKDPQFSYTTREFTSHTLPASDFVHVLEQVRARKSPVSGDDIPEAVFEGINTALDSQQWREEAIKIIFLVGDAPGREEELNAKILRDKARVRNVRLLAFHLKNSFISKNWDNVSRKQYAELSSYSDEIHGTTQENSYLISIDGGPEQFHQIISENFLEIQGYIEGINSLNQSDGLPDSTDGSLSELIFQQATLMSADNSLPDGEFIGWVCDKVLTDPDRMALIPMILLTENELRELTARVRELKEVGEKALRGEGGTTLDFFDLVAKNTRLTIVDPRAVDFRDAFSIPLGISELPYHSDIMTKERGDFENPARVQDFISRMQNKLLHYEDLMRKRGDSKVWKKLSANARDRDRVVGVELYQLP